METYLVIFDNYVEEGITSTTIDQAFTSFEEANNYLESKGYHLKNEYNTEKETFYYEWGWGTEALVLKLVPGKSHGYKF